MAYDIEGYIKRQIERICDSDSCEHRPTYKITIDREKERCRALWANWESLKAQLGDDELRRCLNVYQVDNKYEAHNLIEGSLDGLNVIAPRYAFQLPRVRKLRSFLA